MTITEPSLAEINATGVRMETKTTRLREKIAKLEEEMQRLRGLETEMQARPRAKSRGKEPIAV
jgi:hypothetical protein